MVGEADFQAAHKGKRGEVGEAAQAEQYTAHGVQLTRQLSKQPPAHRRNRKLDPDRDGYRHFHYLFILLLMNCFVLSSDILLTNRLQLQNSSQARGWEQKMMLGIELKTFNALKKFDSSYLVVVLLLSLQYCCTAKTQNLPMNICRMKMSQFSRK